MPLAMFHDPAGPVRGAIAAAEPLAAGARLLPGTPVPVSLPSAPAAVATGFDAGDPWLAALLFLGLCAVVASSMLIANAVLRVRAKNPPPDKLETYECGEEPDGDAWIRFHPRYYLVALVFVVFDVEAAFLLPWALNVRPGNAGISGWAAVVEMVVFVLVLLLGWWYAVRKGALRWQ